MVAATAAPKPFVWTKTADEILNPLAAHRIQAVVALSPSSVVWTNVSPGRDGQIRSQRSCWTARAPPFRSCPTTTRGHHATSGVPGWYEQSLRTFAGRVPAATIPVERIAGRVLLAAGEDDQVWPQRCLPSGSTRAAAPTACRPPH